MIVIDGVQGEGGGQVLRSSLTLSLLTGKPFKMINIRAGRQKSGLLRQHLTAVEAALQVGHARAEGAEMRSQTLTFHPGTVTGGSYHFAVGTAGSATLVLQTVLPNLLTAPQPSHLVLEGGTHNPFAPPFDFLEKSFLPVLGKMGAAVQARLEKPGFYPAGGGRFVIDITPLPQLQPVDIVERGEIVERRARAILSALPQHIAERELAVVARKLGWEANCLRPEVVRNPRGPGNILLLEIYCEHISEVFTGFGSVKVSAEDVAAQAVDAARRYLASGAAVGPYLADQLLIPFAIAGGGSFLTLPLTRHARTNMEIIGRFLELEISSEQVSEKGWLIRVGA
ncbi:MAG: RNA 3'-terminal phosphate cyclase [Calditrichaeota bacterium]|nr:RNA 3'-terminal phosphate cyclase [Calditrichota bacterium]